MGGAALYGHRRVSMTRRIYQIVPHVAAIAVILLCVRLAVWQLERAESRQQLLDAWQDAPAVDLETASDAPEPGYARVIARGRLDAARHILLDNQVRNSRSGVHVFTPFRPEGSDEIWLVNRGWQPMTRQTQQIPGFTTPARPVTIRGRLSEPPDVGIRIGRADPLDSRDWPNLMTYFDLDRIREVFDDPVRSSVILLDPDHPAHLSGDAWQPLTFGPERHRAYAFQWSAIGSVVFIIWIVLTVRSFRRK